MKISVHDIIHYEYVKPDLKRPLIYSILLHLVLGIYLSLQNTQPVGDGFSISMTIQGDELQETIDITEDVEAIENIENTDSENLDTSSEPMDMPGIGFNTSQYNTRNSTDVQDYDPGSNSKNRGRDYNMENLDRNKENNKEWSEEKTEKINIEKSNSSDRVKDPVKTQLATQKTEWVKGISRVLLYQPKIEFPEIFRSQGLQFEVRLQISVNAQGHVINSEVVKSCGETRLDILARNGMMDARYKKKESSMGSGDVDVAYVTVLFAFPK